MFACWPEQLPCARQTKVKHMCWRVAKSVATDTGMDHINISEDQIGGLATHSSGAAGGVLTGAGNTQQHFE
eukprot:3749968-Pleurochrysis_carterae.AAC.2